MIKSNKRGIRRYRSLEHEKELAEEADGSSSQSPDTLVARNMCQRSELKSTEEEVKSIHDKLMYGVPTSGSEEQLPYQFNTGTAFEVSIFTDEDNHMTSSYHQERKQREE